MKELKEKAIRGGFSKICAQGVNYTLRIGSLMVLARLLSPKDFGLVGMVTAFTGVLSLFRDFGLSAATVRQVEVTEKQMSTLFWVNILVGVILGLLTTAIAPVAASFYHEPVLFWVTSVLGTAFIFNAAGVQHSALLQRQMRFTALAAIDVIALFVSTIVGICMAFVGFRYWALVAASVSLPLVGTICLWRTTHWIPGKPCRGVGLHSMMRFGSGLTLNSLIAYVAYNFEKVLLGRFWGADALGIYGRAYQLINIPTDNLNSAVGEVAFAALSRVRNDPPRLRSYFLRGYSFVLALTIPITVAVALCAPDVIAVLLGPKWKEAASIFRLLAPTILVFAFINPISWLIFSLGMVGRSLKIASILAPLVIGGYLAGLPYGPKGVAFAYSSVMILWAAPHIAWCVHGTAISLWDITRAASRPLVSGFVAAVATFGTQFSCGKLSPSLRLFLCTAVLLTAYVGTLFYVMGEKSVYLNLLRGMIRRPAVERNALASVS